MHARNTDTDSILYEPGAFAPMDLTEIINELWDRVDLDFGTVAKTAGRGGNAVTMVDWVRLVEEDESSEEI